MNRIACLPVLLAFPLILACTSNSPAPSETVRPGSKPKPHSTVPNSHSTDIPALSALHSRAKLHPGTKPHFRSYHFASQYRSASADYGHPTVLTDTIAHITCYCDPGAYARSHSDT